jgi:putative membrane protein
MKASMGNSAEVDAGQLASTKAGNAGVMDFGQMMVTDHTNAQAELKMIAGDLNVNAPDSIDAEHMAMKQQLMMMSGMAFDSAYINGQVKDHEATISLFENEANSGNNSRLRDYANNTLPTLRMHKQKADSLAALFP